MKTRCRWGWLAVGLLLLIGCRSAVIAPPGPPTLPEPAPRWRPPKAVDDELHRRAQVAAALTKQGRDHLEAGQVDAAKRLFEQALAQSPHFGPAYFYLAESWLQKNSADQAYAFHGQAALYLPREPLWQDRLRRQKSSLDRRFSALTIP